MAGFFDRLGNWVDEAGTSLNLPEWGISEALAGGNTVNSNMASGYNTPGTTYGPQLPVYGPQVPGPVNGPVNPGIDPNAGQTGGGGGTAPAPAPAYNQRFMGQDYGNPADYVNAVNSAALTEFDQVKKNLKRQYDEDLISLDQYNAELERKRGDLKSQATNLAKQFINTKDAGYANISGRFSQLSPDSYQSIQGVTENKFAGNMNDLEASNKQGLARTAQDISIGQGNLNRQRENTTLNYNQNGQQNQQSYQNRVDSTINDQRSNLEGTAYANDLGNINLQNVAGPDVQQYDAANAFKGLSSSYLNSPAMAGAGQTGAAIKGLTPEEKKIQDYLYQTGYKG